MLDLIVFMTLVGMIGAASGLGLLLSILPSAWRRSLLSLLILPALGMGQTAVIGIYVIASGGRPEMAVYSSVAVSILLVIAAFSLRRRVLIEDFAVMKANLKTDARMVLALLLGSGLVFAFLLLPAPGHPWRLGIDQVGNAITIEYLRSGGDIASLRAAIREQTGHADLAQAYADNMSALQVNIGVASEFLLKSMRWGYPELLAGLMRATGYGPAVLFQLPILFYSGVAAGALATLFFSTMLGWKSSDAVTSGLVAAFSCNLVNLLGEGQHSQYFSLPFMILALVAWGGVRKAYQEKRPTGYAWPAMLTVAVAMIVSVYSEMFSVLCAVMGVASLLDMLLQRRIFQGHHFLAAACVIAGFLLTGPYAYLYPVYILKQLRVVTGGSGGFCQPHWAQMSDILGLTNLYAVTGFESPLAYQVFGRRRLEALCVYSASLFALFLMLRRGIGISAWQRGPWLAAGCVVLVIYRISSRGNNNYLYYKTYVMLSFLFYSWFIYAFHSAIAWPGISQAMRKHGVVLINSLMLVVSLSYLITYRIEARWTGLETMALVDWDRKNDANRYVFLTTEDDFSAYMEAGAIPLNWLNLSWEYGRRRINLEPHLGKRVLILGFSRDGRRPFPGDVEGGRKLLLQTPHLTLLDSGVTLSRDMATKIDAELAEALKTDLGSAKQVWRRMLFSLGGDYVIP